MICDTLIYFIIFFYFRASLLSSVWLQAVRTEEADTWLEKLCGPIKVVLSEQILKGAFANQEKKAGGGQRKPKPSIIADVL